MLLCIDITAGVGFSLLAGQFTIPLQPGKFAFFFLNASLPFGPLPVHVVYMAQRFSINPLDTQAFVTDAS